MSLLNSDYPSVPQYTLLEKLGSGTYATVYKALRQSGARDVVAIKCISKKGLNTVSTENLLKEIELLKKLNHPHIVSLVDFVWDANYIHLILEYCPGGDLFRFIKRRYCLSEFVVRRFLQQLALALHYLHSQNVVHMDLKPQNILLTQVANPKLKIADFGFAHHLTTETHADQVRGSLLYMAPEIVTNRVYSPKCDLWSVGIIMYECLFGKAPFHSDTYDELYSKIFSDQPITLPSSHEIGGSKVEIKEHCLDLLTRLLQRDPKVRIEYSEFFAHPFVDLEHAPSPDCLRKAKSLCVEAVKADQMGNLEFAFICYKNALTYLVPALHFEDDPNKKEELRKRIYEYMTRAEALRENVENGGNQQLLDDVKWAKLVSLCKNSKELSKCLEDINTYNKKFQSRDYEAALQTFESCCAVLLPLIKHEPTGDRKTLLYEMVNAAMSRAERIKKCLHQKNSASPASGTNSSKDNGIAVAASGESKRKTPTKRDLENEEKEVSSFNKNCSVM